MLSCFYIDNYSYQENYLPKYHKLQGHNVEIIASLFTFDERGKGKLLPKGSKYINEYGIPVTRLDYAKIPGSKKLRIYVGLREEIERFAPDIIFIHGVQFKDISIVAKYCKKHKNVKVYVDNHSDFLNSASSWLSKNILHKVIWRHYAHRINPYTEKFYGVLPARVDFLKNIYKLPSEKVELLVMGADDESVINAAKQEQKVALRKKYNILDNEIIIMTGGKINRNKIETLTLMKAIPLISDMPVRLLIFGTVAPEIQNNFDMLLNDKITYIGWKKSEEIYNEFAIADIIAFPGLHSVLWEQAVGSGKACIFRKMPGFTHIDLGGNCSYFEEKTPEAYSEVIRKTILNLPKMSEIALQKGAKTFSYNKIAERSIGG